MAAEEPTLLRPVRLIITTDWDAGFQLRPSAEPLLDVSPGGECMAECFPDRAVAIRSVLVRDFQLVQISTAQYSVHVQPTARGSGLPRAYHLDTPITVQAGERVVALLRNDGPAPLKQKVPTLVRESLAAVTIDPEPTGRAEDAVGCPACGKAVGDSCDGPASHPSRHALYVEHAVRRLEPTRDPVHLSATSADWIIEDVHSGDSAISTSTVRRDRSSHCPTCGSALRDEKRLFCMDAWHSAPIVHAPRVVRTTMKGPGNATLVRGCACGAEITSVSAYADHVSVPRDVMRSMIAIVAIAYDMIDHPKQVDLRDARRQIERCLELTR